MTPMIIAFGLIVILVIIIVMIFRSMFGAGDTQKTPPAQANTPVVEAQNTPNFIVFGATATPGAQIIVTPTPAIEVTPTPAPIRITMVFSTSIAVLKNAMIFSSHHYKVWVGET